MQFSQVAPAGFLSLALIAPAFAETLPEPWETQRMAVSQVTDLACAGVPTAVEEVEARLQNSEPVMMSNIGWLWENCTPYQNFPEKEAAQYVKRSAEAGYPIGMHNHGFDLIDGIGGIKDPERGMAFMIKSAEAGYMEAALVVTEEYISGALLSKDLNAAQTYLERARKTGAPEDYLAELQEQIDMGRSEN